MNDYIACWKNYATFSGRARRREFWMFVLFNFLIGFAIQVVSGVFHGLGLAALAGLLGLVYGLYSLAVLVPSLAATARRLHDTGRSGWWMLISLIPFVGVLVLLVFVCLDSTPGANAYGENPKGR